MNRREWVLFAMLAAALAATAGAVLSHTAPVVPANEAEQEKLLAAWKNGEIQFFPQKWENTYEQWLVNIRDWCVSRQIWWGHRIPVWYCQKCGEVIVSREDPSKCPKCGEYNLAHRVCKSCGTYDGKEVVSVSEKSKKD